MKQYPLSQRQRRMWMAQELRPDESSYQITVTFSMHGALQVSLVRDALQKLVIRHEALRSQLDLIDGVPVQVVPERWDAFSTADVSDLSGSAAIEAERRHVEEMSSTPISLLVEPALRVRLIRFADDHHTLVICVHHMMADMWSMDVIGREFSEFYNAAIQGRDPDLPGVAVSFGDYACIENDAETTGESESDAVAYWLSVLDGAPLSMSLPWDRPTARERGSGAIEGLICARKTLTGLRTCATRNRATVFSVLLAAFHAYLRLITPHDVTNVGTFVAVRHRSELEHMVGLLFDEIPVVIRAQDTSRFSELIAAVRSQVAEALHHPGGGVADAARTLSGQIARTAPPFNVTMQMYQRGDRRLDLEGVESEQHRVFVGAKYDLMLYAAVSDAGLELWFNYDSALLDKSGARRLLRGLNHVLGQVAAQHDPCIGDLEAVSHAEQGRLLEASLGPTLPYPETATIDELFCDTARRFPSRTAGRWIDHSGAVHTLSYSELDELAGRVARSLASSGIDDGSAVGVLASRTGWLLPAYLGVLRAGYAVVLVDADAPADYARASLTEAGASVVLVDPVSRRRHPPKGLGYLDLEHILSASTDDSPAAREAAGPESTAFIVRTSGTTGASKAVLLSHRGVINQVYHRRALFQVSSDDVVALSLSVAFSALPMQLLVPLLSGSTVAVCDAGTVTNPTKLFDFVERHDVTILEITPSQLGTFLRSVTDAERPRLRALRHLITAGEKLSRALANTAIRRYPNVRLSTTWGQSEASGIMCCGFVDEDTDAAEVSEGTPSSNNRLYVLDHRMRPVPFGVEGVGYFAGPSVALGHVGMAGGEARILEDPWHRGERMVNTGDRLIRRADGRVVVRARVDSVVKVRGNRVDLADVTDALLAHPAVRDAHVVAQPAPGAGAELWAYVIADPTFEIGDLRHFLRRRVPEFLQPRIVLPLKAFPRTPNGKLDVRALKALEPQPESTVLPGPLTDFEQRIADQWEVVLAVPAGADDDFFRLGGHSLKAMELSAAVTKVVGINVPVHLVFDRPVLRDFATAVSELIDSVDSSS